MAQLSGAGMDTLDQGPVAPFLKLLQDGGAETKKNHAQFATKGIPGAEPGDIAFIPTKEVLKDLEIAVLAQETCYAEWKPLTQGGGFVAHHPLTIVADPAYRKGTVEKPYAEFLGTNELQFTMYFFVLFRDKNNPDWREGIMALTGGQLAHARSLIGLIGQFTYPKGTAVKPFTFSRIYKVSTFSEPNKRTNTTYYSWKFEPGYVFDFKKDAEFLQGALESKKKAQQSLPKPEEQKALADPSEAGPF